MHIGDGEPAVATAVDAVRLPLPGGWVSTARGQELHAAASQRLCGVPA